MTKKLLGYVGVDSGQLMICDPCYIDGFWVDQPYDDSRVFRFVSDLRAGETLTFGKDFRLFNETPLGYSSDVNTLIASGVLERMPYQLPDPRWGYNTVCHGTLSENGAVQIKYPKGHDGLAVAFRSGYGDGCYPVYGFTNEDGRIVRVVIEMTE